MSRNNVNAPSVNITDNFDSIESTSDIYGCSQNSNYQNS